jgi:hypothetical protein
MTESGHSRSTESTGCVYPLYELIGKISGDIVYYWVAVDLLVKGDLCGFLGWLLLVGPFTSFFISKLWPIFLIYWLRESGRL